jgi:hypothetical protein
MGRFFMEIMPLRGSLLSGNQQLQLQTIQFAATTSPNIASSFERPPEIRRGYGAFSDRVTCATHCRVKAWYG